ncbi:MAG: GAF domain-containing protein [Anaerolineales bacterium]|nr:GAF domain-containing protein [Anaerolineales bacterium]
MASIPDTALALSPDQLAQLVQVSVTLNSTLNPKELLRYIIESAANLLNCEAASILLYDEKHGELHFTTATGSDPNQLAQIPVPLEGSIAGTVFREKRHLVINDVSKEPRHFAQVGEQVQFQPRSLLAVPMRIRDQVTGVLEALNKRQGDFSESDVRLLSVIASQAAVAINNARLVQALQIAYDELSRVDKIKSDFMAIASHELRTPLGVILGYATFLKEDAHGELSEHANMVLTSALRLRALVEDMTNMNLLQAGESKLIMHPVPIQQPINAAFDEITATAEVKGQRLLRNMPKEPLFVMGDAPKLELVFANLLNNAIRFTPEGGEISIAVRPQRKEIWIDIQDNGIGIPPAELENVFKEFYQVEDHMRRRHGGMGLGLAIARGLIQVHQGRIWAESKGENQGATMKVVLPRLET